MSKKPIASISASVKAQSKLSKDEPKTLWEKREPHEEEFLKLKQARINELIEFTQPYWEKIKENIRNMEGKVSVRQGTDSNDVVAVMPITRAFVEAKTAEEIKVSSTYRYTPKKDSMNSTFALVIEAMRKHVHKKTNYLGNRHEMKRQKNIFGNSIKRKGYKYLVQKDKIPVKFDDKGRPTEWIIKNVPVYDDLFEEIISPLQFAVDPNATTLNDAEDCYTWSYMSKEHFFLQYLNNPNFINVDKVKPGAKFKFNPEGNFEFDRTIKNNGVILEEYFSYTLNEWVQVANGVLITPLFQAEDPDTKETEWYSYPLPDIHRRLPFVAEYNQAAFTVGTMAKTFVDTATAEDEITALSNEITGKQCFWRKGDPEIIKDMVSLETGLTQAMFRNAKLASQVIIATDRGYKFKSKKWKSGAQSIGMKGHFEATPLGQTQQGQIQPILDYLFQMKVLSLGLDPRNISQDSKTKSATEAAIIQETSMRRLQENIEYNIQHCELPDAEMTLKNIAQYYSVAETKRIVEGEDIKSFDDVEYIDIEGKDGKMEKKPIIGKKYRRIGINKPVKEVKEENKYILTTSDTGEHSFVVRPELINILEVDIDMVADNKLGELRSVVKQQTSEMVNLILTLHQAATPGPNGEAPAISKDDIPPMKEVIRRWANAHDLGDWAQDQSDGQKIEGTPEQGMQEYLDKSFQTGQPSVVAGAPSPTGEAAPAVLSSTPNVRENFAS